jgi:two-component system NtrC family sensor kinase
MRPIDKIAEAKRQAISLMIGVAGSGALLVIFISYLIGKNLSSPISNLVAFTNRVAGGNLDIQCEVTTQDEIGNLTAAFNQMTVDLRNSRDELIQVERLATAGKMAASFAHEIRNPLSSMRMLTQMLRKPSLTEAKRHQSQQYILEEIERIDLIVKGLMDFAKPEELKLEKYDLQRVLREIASLMEANLQHHKISLIESYDSAVGPVLFDYDKIKQVIINLLLNAMAAQPSDGEIEISTEKNRDQVCMCVSDNGTGIPPSDLERVFEPFFTTKLEGTGLGLANSKRIIDQHGGEMRIESILGQGTKVTIEIPIKANASQA